jgi:integrase
VRWRLPNGNDRQRRFASRRAAQAWLKSVLVTPTDTKAGRTTFEHVADAALIAKQLKPSTMVSYRGIVRRQLLPTFGGMRIDKITRADVVEWLAALPVASESTRRHWVIALNKVMRFAMSEGLIAANPVVGLIPPMPKHRPDAHARYLTAAEVDKLALALRDAGCWPADVLVRFAAWTGLRAGELVALDVGDVNVRRGVVSVSKTAMRHGSAWEMTTPKSQRSNREVPLAPHVVSLLREYLAARPDHGLDSAAPLWPGRKIGGNIRPRPLDWSKRHDHGSFYGSVWRPATVASGLAPLRFHDMRHTFASLCAEAGVPIHKVSRWMGHANVSTTDMVYTHLFTDHSTELAKLSKLAGEEVW